MPHTAGMLGNSAKTWLGRGAVPPCRLSWALETPASSCACSVGYGHKGILAQGDTVQDSREQGLGWAGAWLWVQAMQTPPKRLLMN